MLRASLFILLLLSFPALASSAGGGVSPSVSSFSAGTTGFTPNSPTTGSVVLGGILNVANGGTGTATPGLIQGTNITITGSWPNQTITDTNTANVASVSNSDGTLTISPTTGAVVASLALGNANTWTGQQTFNTSAPIFGTMTAGSVLFAGTSGLLSQDNSNFFWDGTNHLLDVSQVQNTTLTRPSGTFFLGYQGPSGGAGAQRIIYAQTDSQFPIQIDDLAQNHIMLLSQYPVGNSTLTVGNLTLNGTNPVITTYGVDLQVLQDNNENKGYFYTITSGIDFDFHNRVASNIPIVVEAHASQTADLQQWWGTAGTEVAGVTATGGAYFADKVGIGSTTPRAILDISQNTGAEILPIGTTGQRPTAVEGMIRKNSTLNLMEAYINAMWSQFLSGSDGTPTCGAGCSSITSGSTDARGSLTSGAALTSITLNFSTTLSSAPFCVVGGSSTVSLASTSSTTTLTITTLSIVTSDVVSWICAQ